MDVEVENMAELLCRTGRLQEEMQWMQHGRVTVYAHSVHVAEESLRLAKCLQWDVDETALIRGALLHDYFLYDWHEKKGRKSFHGFRHPYIALHNARRDYGVSSLEANIILRHMFPLVPVPPAYREAWIVCLADKYCALQETAAGWASDLVAFWGSFEF